MTKNGPKDTGDTKPEDKKAKVAKPERSDYDRRIQGMVSIAVPADRVTKPVFGRHGFASGALVVDWPAIVGSAVAAHTLPLRIRFSPQDRSDGTLEIKVASSAFSTEIQHLEPLILERINGYFGWKAVARLKLKHGPLPPKRPIRPAPPEPEPEASARLDHVLEQVEDPALREALARLGKYVAARKA
ncbi:MAG: DciA family protein [Magnetospirillum sp.]|nr:DciA family protein [Magnetospirillum sp.]